MAFYFQEAEPTPSFAGDGWISSGSFRMRNSDNTAWNIIFETTLFWDNMAFMPTSGGQINSALTGSHSLAAAANPAFTTSAKVAGLNVVTEAEVQSAINDAISVLTFTGVVFGAVQANTKIAINTGLTALTATPNWTVDIPLPSFKNEDGTTETVATKSQCKCFVSPAQWKITNFQYIDGSPMFDWQILDQSTSSAFRFYAKGINNKIPTGEDGLKLWYFIIAVRD